MALFVEFQGANNRTISLCGDNTVCFNRLPWNKLKGLVDI